MPITTTEKLWIFMELIGFVESCISNFLHDTSKTILGGVGEPSKEAAYRALIIIFDVLSGSFRC